MRLSKLVITSVICSVCVLGFSTSYSQEMPDQLAQQDPLTLQDHPVQHDPLEPYNRVVFTINDKLDKYIIKPAAEFYNKVIPRPLNIGIDNIFNNVDGTKIILNDLLQANFFQSARDTWRFAINTTVGVGGLFDVGQRVGLPYQANGLGLTLTKWGYKNSAYFVVPLLGPKTIRDTLAIPADIYSTVTPYLPNVDLRNSLFAISLLDKRAQLLRFQGVYDEMAIDPYIFQRDAYLQHHAYLAQRLAELNNPYTADNTKAMKRDYYIAE